MGLFGKKKEIIESYRAQAKRLSDDLYHERKTRHDTQELNEQLSSELIAVTEELDDLKRQYADLKEQYDNRLGSLNTAVDEALYWREAYEALIEKLGDAAPVCEACQLQIEGETE